MESLLLFLLTENVLGRRTVKLLLKELLVCGTGLAFVMETESLLLLVEKTSLGRRMEKLLLKEQCLQAAGKIYVTETACLLLLLNTEFVHGVKTEKHSMKRQSLKLMAFATETDCLLLF